MRYYQFLKKYGISEVILPPPSDEEIEVEIPVSKPVPVIEEVDPELIKHKFHFYDSPESKKGRPTIIPGHKGKKIEKELLAEEPELPSDLLKGSKVDANTLVKMCEAYYQQALK